MTSFTVFFILSACIVGSFGKHFADSGNCRTPDRIRGRMFMVVDSGFTLEMHFQNDNRAKAQRYTSHNPNMAFDTIMLYDRGLQYTLVNNGSICHVSQIQHDFYPIAVPPAAHMLGRGDLAGEMAVLSYGMLIGNSSDAGMMLFVAEDTCLPAYVIAKGGGQTALTTFLDVVPGVDPDAFTVPASCSSAPVPTPTSSDCDHSIVRREASPKVAKLETGEMSWQFSDVPDSKRGTSWF